MSSNGKGISFDEEVPGKNDELNIHCADKSDNDQ